MKKQITTILALSFVLCAAPLIFAQDLTIDDFTTGAYTSGSYKSGTNESIESGSMLGGSRDTYFFICDTKKKGDCAARNPYDQPSAYGFFPATGSRAAAMVQTAGYQVGPRIDMLYGEQSPMAVDFSGYQKIRISFQSLSQGLNFNIQLFTGTSWAQGGCNIPTYPSPFSVELPLNLFVVTKGFDFTQVKLMDVIFQTDSGIGSVDFGATSIVLTNTTAGGEVIDCHY